MAREYGKALTKEMLLDWGFTDIRYLPHEQKWTFNDKTDWYIERVWRKNSNKEPIKKRITITEAVCKHKYSADKVYLKITFSVGGKVYSIPLSRVIYAWFNGPIGQGEVIDHINNNSFDNRPENLQKLSVGENLAKRFIDNPKFARNQYELDLKQIVHKMFETGLSYEEALAKVNEIRK